ncbi:G2/mitotic-specific cyclin S13-7-like [Punica granatum]|uniref:Uncharacterized protein n=2 Tax=Punica granatum TaxID=22663 RepID=A0A218X125_PUNGR|nr:G2/mitotic-specific cyclin S13-7-like [Punica granatum]OWM78885.1 hypothetical protein CDL15_Pgr003056 [Punica granatum]PKI31945.1 hypothetical protein CRG98_047663 [Punica granatum]
MASRPIVPTQARGEAVIGGGGAVKPQQHKKNGGGHARNRKALGDIGNLVTLRGVDGKQPQITRPITRSFCAQLLANAQAAAAAENNKKQACVKVNGAPALLEGNKPAKKAEPAKAAQKKAPAAKAKSKEVIEISPDPDEEARAKAKNISKQEGVVHKRKDGEGSSRKKNKSLTSVLTARSKAACGIAKKPKEQIVDIDAADADNELAAVEYVEDLYQFYKEAENENRPTDYMPSQPDITEKMRTILVDWLVEIHNKFDLMPETLYLTINLIDRFLSVKAVPRRELQLLGMGALLTASKYEEIWAPEVNDLVCIADRAYSNEQVLAMEKTILGKLEWYLTVPTNYVFLVRFIKAALADRKLESMVYFLSELGLMSYSTLSYPPSMVAASAVYAARCTLNISPFWSATLKVHTGYTEAQIMDCAKLLVGFHANVKDSKFQVVYRKYSSSQREAVALLSPAKALLDDDSVKTSA